MAHLLSKSKEQVAEALSKATAAMGVSENSGAQSQTSTGKAAVAESGKYQLADRYSSYVLTWMYADLPKVYVDETAGDDVSGDGSESLPYKTLLGAYTARSTSDLSILVKKASDPAAAVAAEPSTHVPAGDASLAAWQPASGAGVKKAKKAYEGVQKKQAKAAEQAAKDKDREAADKQKLEEAKKVVLTEPEGVEKALKIKIKQGKTNRQKRVRVFGWVHRLRQQSGLTFLVLRDGTGYLQCILSGKLVRSPSLWFVCCASSSLFHIDPNL